MHIVEVSLPSLTGSPAAADPKLSNWPALADVSPVAAHGSRSTITAVKDSEGLAAVKALCTDFLQWNRARYAHLEWLIERYYDPAHWAAYLS